MAIIKIIIRSCGTPLASSLSPGLGASMIAQGFKKFQQILQFSTHFLVVLGPLPCWRSVIDTFLPTQSSSLIGQSLMLRPILNNFICFFLRYESSTLILYKKLSSSIFQSLSVSKSLVTPNQISTFCQYIKA